MTPANQVRTFLLTASKYGARLFRMNVGLAWCGSRIEKHANGSITIHDPRPFKAGAKGMSDSGGWTSVLITPEMVGTTVAVHCAIEAKLGKGRLTPDQLAYILAVQKAGGRAGVARSEQDVIDILSGTRTDLIR